MIIFLLVVQIIIFIVLLLLMLKIIKILSTNDNIKVRKKSNFNKKEYLNSLNFNKRLDGIIVSLLGKYDNESIVNIADKTLREKDSKLNNISKEELKDYISKVLSNYSNTYNANDFEEEIQSSNTYYQDPAREISSKLNNEVDLSNTLRNFYDD